MDVWQILTASIAYDKQPSFDIFAPGQFTTVDDTLRALDLSAFNKWNNGGATPGAAGARPVSLE